MVREEQRSTAASAAPARAGNIYETLRARIISGELVPGERLVEQAIAEQASVSRTPVREALHRLAMDGLAAPSGRGMAVVDFSGPELSELCTVRSSMEGLAARLAASSASPIEVEILRTVVDEMAGATEAGDVTRQVELNHRYHETVWQAAHNGYLRRQLALLRGLIERGRETTLQDRARQEEALREHRALLEAIERRDGAAAEEVAVQHFDRASALRLLRA